jgi:hypothetical protein
MLFSADNAGLEEVDRSHRAMVEQGGGAFKESTYVYENRLALYPTRAVEQRAADRAETTAQAEGSLGDPCQIGNSRYESAILRSSTWRSTANCGLAIL